MGLDKNYEKIITDENNIKKSEKISRIVKIIKKNILENDNNENDSQSYYNTSNNLFYKNKTKNSIFGTSENKIFKNVFTNTPNRYVLNKKDTLNNNDIDNDSINIKYKKRYYTPNIAHLNKDKNDNIEMKPLDSKDYDNILKTQLADMENQINLMNKINISEVKQDYLNKRNPINIKKQNYGKTETSDFYDKNNIK